MKRKFEKSYIMPSPSFFIVSLATLVSFFFYEKFKYTKNIYFIYYLVFSFLIYFMGFLFKHIFNIIDYPIYNTYVILSFFFYIIFYRSLFRIARNKKIMDIFLLFYCLFILVDFVLLKTAFLTDFIVYSTVSAAIMLIITVILFLIEIINNERIIFYIKRSFTFWISVGSLLFFIGVIPIIITASFLNFDGIFDSILAGLNFIMYGSIILGFLWSDKNYDY